MSKTGFYKGRLGIGLTSTMGMGDGNPRYPLDINGDIRLTGAIVNSQGLALNMVNPDSLWAVDAASISYTTGNVGIGTTSPLDQLHVYKAGTDQAWKGRGIFGNETCAFVCGVYHNKVHLGGHNGALNAWYDITINPGGGNVGIGTTDPGSYKLKVQGQIYASNNITSAGVLYGAAVQLGNGQLVRWGSSNYGASIQGSENGSLKLYVNTSERMRIDSGGNVGIGTTSPSGMLHVKGADPKIFLQDTEGGSTNADVQLYFCESDGTGGNPNHGYRIRYNHRDLFFDEGDYPSNYSNVMTFHEASSGGAVLVGIGTTSPLYNLEVKGGIFGATYDSDHNYGVMINMPSASYGRIQTIRQGVGYNYALALQPNGGNVGIGTDSPKGKLAIQNTNSLTHIVTEIDKFSLYFDSDNSSKRNGMGWSYNSSYGAHVGITCSNNNAHTLELWGTNGRRVNICAPSGNETAPWDHPGLSVWQNKVGIGTTSPLCALHIEKPLPSSSYPMTIPSANSTSFGVGVHQFLSSRYTDGNFNQHGLVMGTDGTCYYLQHMSTNHNNYYNLNLNPKGGNVGIGTTSPYTRLDVEGTLRCSGFENTNSWNYSNGTGLSWTYFEAGTGSNLSATPSGEYATRSLGYQYGNNAAETAWTHTGTTNAIYSNKSSSDYRLRYHCKLRIKKTDTYYFSFHVYSAYVDGYGGHVGAALNVDGAVNLFRKSVGGNEIKSRTGGYYWKEGEVHSLTFFIFANGYCCYGQTGWGLLWTATGHNPTNHNSQYTGRSANSIGGISGWDLDWINSPGGFFDIGQSASEYPINLPELRLNKRGALSLGNGTMTIRDGRVAIHGGYNTEENEDFDQQCTPFTISASKFYIHDDTHRNNGWMLQCVKQHTGSVGNGINISHGTNNGSYAIRVYGAGENFYVTWGGHMYARSRNTISDDRLKHNEEPVINAMDVINKLKLTKYFKGTILRDEKFNYELDESGNPITDEVYDLESGFLAQEVKNIPELSHCVTGEEFEIKTKKELKKVDLFTSEYDPSGNKIDDVWEEVITEEKIPKKLYLNYQEIFCYNVQATQELYKENQALEAEVATLKSELAAIKQHLGI